VSDQTKFVLPESEIPKAWYNVQADLPFELPPVLHPGTKEPVGPNDLAPLFPMALIQQEVTRERWVEIPEPVRAVYRLWRSTPLYRAHRLEKALSTPAKIYYKYEGVSPAGSHKPNTAVAQAFYNKEAGVKRLATETGAGQWGSALAFAGQLFGIDVKVYMVRVSYDQKPYRRNMMETWGAKVVPSPSPDTNAGRQMLAQDAKCSGSLGLAISEAVEDAVTNQTPTKYSLGSVLNHVLLHQTVIGLESKRQLDMAGVYPDVIVGCVGGGSNFAGFCFPFVPDKLKGKGLRFVAVEPTACPTLTKGAYTYDFGDTTGLTPLIMMYTLGHSFVPPGIHAGGLRYHGDAPLLCQLVHEKVIEARAYPQNPVFEAARLFAETEGIIPAPETSHAIKAAVDEAMVCKETKHAKVIVFNFSGHGHFDLAAYDAFLEGQLKDIETDPDEMIKKALAELPKVQGQ
jgi:tryptophan synthase beta chain